MGRLTNAIKALFSKNTTNAASASGARVPIVDVSGDPIGNASMADLASVLGGIDPVLIDSTYDMNNIKTHGRIYCTINADNPANMPSEENVYNNIIFVFKQTGRDRNVQIVFSCNNASAYYRIFNSSIWSDWKRFSII